VRVALLEWIPGKLCLSNVNLQQYQHSYCSIMTCFDIGCNTPPDADCLNGLMETLTHSQWTPFQAFPLCATNQSSLMRPLWCRNNPQRLPRSEILWLATLSSSKADNLDRFNSSKFRCVSLKSLSTSGEAFPSPSEPPFSSD